MTNLRSLFVALALTTALAACGSSTSESSAGAPAESSETTVAGTETTVAGEESTETTAAGEETMVDADSMVIMGSLVLEEGASLEPGGVLTVQLNDMTVSDPIAKLRGESVIELTDAATPIAFELAVPLADIDPALRYSIKATISDAAGTVLWTTRSANFIEADAQTNDLGELTLVSAS